MMVVEAILEEEISAGEISEQTWRKIYTLITLAYTI